MKQGGSDGAGGWTTTFSTSRDWEMAVAMAEGKGWMREAKEVVTVAAQAEQQDLVVVKVEANVERLGVGSCSGKRRGQRRGCGERLMLLRLKGDGVGIESEDGWKGGVATSSPVEARGKDNGSRSCDCCRGLEMVAPGRGRREVGMGVAVGECTTESNGRQLGWRSRGSND
ncbi:hypothetical protein BHE74_00040089 [Ensete ventricosum]|nr:hypothetical protein BHE74_00040089 [Ensete ventricosum]